MKRILLLSAAVVCASSFFVSCLKEVIPPKVMVYTNYDSVDLVLQPGPDSGQDCLVAYRENDNNLYATSNHKPTHEVTAIRWSYNSVNAGNGTNRTYIKFAGLSNLPDSSIIIEAKLSLFGVESGVAAPLGNSYYPGSPYESFGDNAAWLKRVAGDWADSTITWNNKPETFSDDQASIPASSSQWNNDVADINVTNMVKTMVDLNENFGFCLQLKNEDIYRSILFGSSEAANKAKRPRLVVKYALRSNN